MSDSKNGAGSSSKKKGMKREEAVDRIQELKEKWMDQKRKRTKISDEKLFREVQKLTEEIHRQAEPEEYKEIFAEVEGKMICSRHYIREIDMICSRISPFLSGIFGILAYILGILTDAVLGIGRPFALIYSVIVIVVLAIVIGVLIWPITGSNVKEEAFYEFLYKNLKRRRSK